MVAVRASMDMDTPQANLDIPVDSAEVERLAENPPTGAVTLA